MDTSGQLRTKAPLDHETKDSYTVTVTATDPENASDTIDVTITVTDVNEAPEVTGQASINYAENGTEPVHTYVASDPESNPITWSLTGADSRQDRNSPRPKRRRRRRRWQWGLPPAAAAVAVGQPPAGVWHDHRYPRGPRKHGGG